jgi:transcriptional regulator with XRE-family HTH domain
MSRGGDLIKETRRRAGLSQAELARRASTTQSAVARWESGRVSPSLDTTMRVMRAAGFDLDYSVVPYDDSDHAQALRLAGLTPQERLDHLRGVVNSWRQFVDEGAASMRRGA